MAALAGVGSCREWQEILAADQTKNRAIVYYAVVNYLRHHPESDLAALEDLLRRHQCLTYLMAHFPSSGSLGRAEWPPGHEKRYHLYLYHDSPQNRHNLLRFVTPASKIEQKQKLRDCGFSLYHLRDFSPEVPLSFVEVLQSCLKKCEPVKEFYLKNALLKKSIPFGKPLHAEFKIIQELFDQGFLYFPILASDGSLKGMWTVPRQEVIEGMERLGFEHSMLKGILEDFLSSPEAFIHEFCLFQFIEGSIQLNEPVRRFVFGMFEDALKLLNCKGLVSISFKIDL